MADIPTRQDPPATNVTEFTVSEISSLLKRTVEDTFGLVRVRGEISGFRGLHASGHCYFTLKDDRARLEAVIWRSTVSRLRHRPEEGMEVVATGKLTTYPGSSKYQIVIDNLEPAGIGALMALIEERKKRLAAEGLFDEARKKALPYLPKVIGVITSPTGAVIRDVLHRLGDRFPLRVVIWPVRVQGETTAGEVAHAIAGFNRLTAGGPVPRPDLIIVARGGGSIEDLWGFNDEAVVRAAAASAIPLISAIGHETDWTLIDLAADRRAPTPTGAAEIAVPVKAELEALVATLGVRLRNGFNRGMEAARTALRAAARGLGSPEAILSAPRQRLDVLGDGLARGLSLAVRRKEVAFGRVAGRLGRRLLDHRLARAGERLDGLTGRARTAYRNRLAAQRSRLGAAGGRLHWRRLERLVASARDRLERDWRLIVSLGPENVLARGYGLVRDARGIPVTRAGAIAAGQAFTVQMHDGAIAALATGAPGEAGRPQKKAHSGPPRPTGGQGSLF